jgi:hypothetical protein
MKRGIALACCLFACSEWVLVTQKGDDAVQFGSHFSSQLSCADAARTVMVSTTGIGAFCIEVE